MKDERRGCDQEAVFELADGNLGPQRAEGVRGHLAACPGCRGLYERQVGISARLGALGLAERPECEVSRVVAMALPTRTAKGRAMWALLAASLLVVALLALELSGASPALPVVGAVAWSSGALAGSWDVLVTFISIAGRWMVYLLLFGAFVDLAIAALVYAASRRAAREA